MEGIVSDGWCCVTEIGRFLVSMIRILYGVHETYANVANIHEEPDTYIHGGNLEYIDPANTYAR
jgi:hypothetical protein